MGELVSVVFRRSAEASEFRIAARRSKSEIESIPIDYSDDIENGGVHAADRTSVVT